MFQQNLTSTDRRRTSMNRRIINRRQWRFLSPRQQRQSSSSSHQPCRNDRGVRKGSNIARSWTAVTGSRERGRRGEWRDNDVDNSMLIWRSSTPRSNNDTSIWKRDPTQVSPTYLLHYYNYVYSTREICCLTMCTSYKRLSIYLSCERFPRYTSLTVIVMAVNSKFGQWAGLHNVVHRPWSLIVYL